MHILFDSHGLDEFGESEMFKAYSIVQSATDYARVSVVVPDRWVDRVPSLCEAGVNVIPVPYDSRRFPGNPSLEYMYWLYSRRALHAARGVLESVDVVHRLNPMAVRHASSLGLVGKPFVIGAIGWSRLPPAWTSSPRAAARNLLKRVDRIRTGTSITRLHRMYAHANAIALGSRAALEALPQSFHEKCVVVGEAIDTGEYPAAPPPDNPEPVVLYVGRLIPYKGVEYLVDALARLRDVPWRLRIVGDGPLQGPLEERVARAGIAGRVEFAGRIPRGEVVGHYALADVCCSPGLNESTGNVNVEAMACARPVIVADWAGPRDYVTDECGLRVPVGSPTELTLGLERALRRLLRDPALRRRMGEAGRQRALSVFDTRVVMGRYRDLHERAAS